MKLQRRLPNSAMARQQSGFALFIGMAILLLLSLIGISAMQGTTMQEKMAGNYKVQHEAFQATETSVVNGEIVLQDVIKAADVNPLFLVSNQVPWSTLATTVPTVNSVQQGKVNLNVSLKTNNSNNVYFYYVSAGGIGQKAGASAVVQTTYVH